MRLLQSREATMGMDITQMTVTAIADYLLEKLVDSESLFRRGSYEASKMADSIKAAQTLVINLHEMARDQIRAREETRKRGIPVCTPARCGDDDE